MILFLPSEDDDGVVDEDEFLLSLRIIDPVFGRLLLSKRGSLQLTNIVNRVVFGPSLLLSLFFVFIGGLSLLLTEIHHKLRDSISLLFLL